MQVEPHLGEGVGLAHPVAGAQAREPEHAEHDRGHPQHVRPAGEVGGDERRHQDQQAEARQPPARDDVHDTSVARRP